ARGDDGRHGRRRDRAPAELAVEEGVADVGDEQPDDADDAEFGKFMDDLPEPVVQSTYYSHRAITSRIRSTSSPWVRGSATVTLVTVPPLGELAVPGGQTLARTSLIRGKSW